VAARCDDTSAGFRIPRVWAPLVGALASAFALLGEPNLSAAAAPNGSQFQVNSYTTADQSRPSVASDSGGNFVVTWESDGSPGTDTSARSVQGQLYSSAGSAVGAQFQVNSYTTSDQFHASVASDSAGNFVVVWQSYGSPGTDTDGASAQGQRYSAGGAAVGGEFQVNTYTTSNQLNASIASDAAGHFVVVWASNGSAGTDTSSYSVQGQRYDASGATVGGQFQVNTYTTGAQNFPSITSNSSGFVVAWLSYYSGARSVQAQRFDASGSLVGGEFRVNTVEFPTARGPSIASDSSGDFVVVWGSTGSAGTDNSGYSVQGQRYNSSGAAVGGEFQVNTFTTGAQQYPLVASDAFGDFVVVWETYAVGNTGDDVHGQLYNSNGSPIGGEFLVNSYTTGTQSLPSVASDSIGRNFVTAWASAGSVGTDTSGLSVQSQRYLPEAPSAQSLGAMIAMLIALARQRRIG